MTSTSLELFKIDVSTPAQRWKKSSYIVSTYPQLPPKKWYESQNRNDDADDGDGRVATNQNVACGKDQDREGNADSNDNS